MKAATGQQGSLGIGIPGSLEPVSRLGKGASSTWLLGQPVERDLRDALQRDIRVENDADCFAASEAVDGAGAGYNVVFAVILGSGAAPASRSAARPITGPTTAAANGATIRCPFPIPRRSPAKACYCGRHGCMETWVSGRAFEALHTSHTGETLKAGEILDKMRGGDRLCRLLWERYVDRVARGLATVVNTLDPDIFVMGGGMSNADELYDDLPPALARRTFSTVFHTPIRRAVHGDSSGVRGAAWLWK